MDFITLAHYNLESWHQSQSLGGGMCFSLSFFLKGRLLKRVQTNTGVKEAPEVSQAGACISFLRAGAKRHMPFSPLKKAL